MKIVRKLATQGVADHAGELGADQCFSCQQRSLALAHVFFPIIYIICRPLALGIGECFQPSFVGMAIFPLRGDAHAEVLSACAKAQEWAAAFQVLQMEDAPWFSTRG